MHAPIYSPAAAFEPPVAATRTLGIDNFSIAELEKMPAAWKVILNHYPQLQQMVDNPMMQPHLSNLTVRAVSVFLPNSNPEVFTVIDAELRGIAQDERAHHE